MYIIKINEKNETLFLTGYPESIMLTKNIEEASIFTERNLTIAKFRNRFLFEIKGIEIIKISAL